MKMTQEERAAEFKELKSMISEAILRSYELEAEMEGPSKTMKGLWHRKVTENLEGADEFLTKIEKRKDELGLS